MERKGVKIVNKRIKTTSQTYLTERNLSGQLIINNKFMS